MRRQSPSWQKLAKAAALEANYQPSSENSSSGQGGCRNDCLRRQASGNPRTDPAAIRQLLATRPRQEYDRWHEKSGRCFTGLNLIKIDLHIECSRSEIAWLSLDSWWTLAIRDGWPRRAGHPLGRPRKCCQYSPQISLANFAVRLKTPAIWSFPSFLPLETHRHFDSEGR